MSTDTDERKKTIGELSADTHRRIKTLATAAGMSMPRYLTAILPTLESMPLPKRIPTQSTDKSTDDTGPSTARDTDTSGNGSGVG